MTTTPEEVAENVTQQIGTILEHDCLEERFWSFFLASSLIVLFAGLIVILSHRLVAHLLEAHCRRTKTPAELADEEIENIDPNFGTRLKWHAEGWISGQTTVGKIMVRLKNTLSNLIRYFETFRTFSKRDFVCFCCRCHSLVFSVLDLSSSTWSTHPSRNTSTLLSLT